MKRTSMKKLSAVAQEALRKRVMHAILVDGMKQVKAAKVFGVGRTSIHRWLRAVEKDGEKALDGKKRGRVSRSTIPGYQAASAVRIITDHCPDQIKMPFVLWTRDAVKELLENKFGFKASLSTVGRLLRRWGFTPQKPVRRAYEQNQADVDKWLNEVYPVIARAAKAEGAEIHWLDEMGIRSDHQAGTSYGRRGETPVIPGTGQRFKCNMISSITNRGHLSFMLFRDNFTAPLMTEFMRRLLLQRDRKIYLIVDNHPVHRSYYVTDWVEERSEHLRLFRLPSYSPELNPDEMLNNDVKSNALGRQRPKNLPDMMKKVRSYLRGRQRRPEKVRRYFHEKHVRYAAEEMFHI